jgi:hypothetical protein
MGNKKPMVMFMALVSGGLLAVALAYWLVRPSGSIGPEGPPSADRRGEAASEELSRVRGQLAALRARQQRQAEDQALLSRRIEDLHRSLQAGEDRSSGPREESGSPRSDRELLTERLSQLDRAFTDQPVDGAWNGEAEGALAGLVASPALSGARLASVGCRSTLCRMHVHVPESQGLEPLVDALPQVLGWKTEGFAKILAQASGEQEAVLFLARPGHPLPPITAAPAGPSPP